MNSLIKRLQRLLQRSEPSESEPAAADATLKRALNPVQTSDPDTHRQWARLQSRLSAERPETTMARRVPRLAGTLAFATLAIAATVVFFMSREPLTDRYVTARGEQTNILLPDSSQVSLNHTSALAVRRFSEGDPRRLSLSGEALFRVQKNGSPFIVSNGFAEVAVVGTEFNVRSRDGLLEVAVLHGTVRVARSSVPSGAALTLTAGQRASVRRDADPVRMDDIPSPEFPGWLHGKLFLTRSSLEDACREIEARFDVTVRTIAPSSTTITGVLEAASADDALRSLSLLTGKELRKDHGTYVFE